MFTRAAALAALFRKSLGAVSHAWLACSLLAPSPGRALEILTPPFASPAPAPVGTEIAFDASAAGDAVEYAYDFGDGSAPRSFASASRAVHRYARPGRFPVVARIRDAGSQRVFTFFVLVHPPLAARRPASATSILVDASRRRVWSVNPDHGTVACLDADALTRLFEVPVGAGPRTLAQAPDGTLWVANQDDATVSILSPADGSLVATVTLPFASRPYGLIFAPDGSAAYVSLEAVGKVARIHPATRALSLSTADAGRLRGLALAEGGSLLAARFLTDGMKARVSALDPGDLTRRDGILLAEDSTADAENQGRGSLNHLAGPVIAPDGKRALLLAKKDNLRRGLVRDGLALTFENTVRAAVVRLDLEGPASVAELPGSRLDIDDSEGPSAAAYGPWGFPVFMAFQGSDKVVALNPWDGARVLSIPEVGAAPRGLAMDSAGGRLFVQAFLGRTVSVYDVKSLVSGGETGAPLLKVIPASASEPLSGSVLMGKRIFHNASDPRMSRDGYMGCASCHAEGGEDGRVWDFTDRGEGLRNTQSLLGRAGTGYGPLHWSANFDEVQDFEHDIRGPFGGKGFLADIDFHAEGRDTPLGGPKAGLSPELDALAAYVSSLSKVPPSPFRAANGSMTADALAGKALFRRADVGCALCHSGLDFTDSRIPGGVRPVPGSARDTVTPEGFLLHDVGTLSASSGKRLGAPLRGLDTPGLKGLWFSAPYFHDGSAATVQDLIARAEGGRHGNTSMLSPAEREQLAAYLLQLDDLDERGTGTRRGGTRPSARGWSLLASPLGTGWSIEAPGAPGALDVRVLDPRGRILVAARLPEGGPGVERTWIWRGTGASGEVPLIEACAPGGCASKRLAR